MRNYASHPVASRLSRLCYGTRWCSRFFTLCPTPLLVEVRDVVHRTYEGSWEFWGWPVPQIVEGCGALRQWSNLAAASRGELPANVILHQSRCPAGCSSVKRGLEAPLVVGFAVLWNVLCGVVVDDYRGLICGDSVELLAFSRFLCHLHVDQ